MTEPSTAGDRRRATALVCHWGRRNIEGYNAIIREAQETKRVTQLLWEVLSLHAETVPILLTEDGIACATQVVYEVATIPVTDDENPGIGDCRRAAQLMFAFGQRDITEYNCTIEEAVDLDRATELFMALLELYRRAVPQLYTDLGLHVLEGSILQWAALEGEEAS